MSLFGLDEMYNELLLEAKTPEEIKKILTYQFVQGKGIPEEVLDKIFEIDPTKKKTYTKWVLMQWATEKENILSALQSGQISDMFKYFQERANNGLNLLGMKSFEDALNVVPVVNKDPIFGPIPEDEKDDPKNDFDIVFDSPEWKIAIPHTWQADEKLGVGCRWCTAGAFGNGKSYFDRYTASGPLWVNFDKRRSQIGPRDNIEYPYTRYQFCFEAGIRGEMCDAEDDRIDVEEMDIPEDVLKFYTDKNPHYGEILSGDYDDEKAWARYDEMRIDYTAYHLESCTGGPGLRLMPSFNEDEPHINDGDPYEVYTDEDIRDSLDGIKYPDGVNDIHDECNGFPMLVMTNTAGWRNHTELNVYYERIGRYDASWHVANSVRAFGGNNKGKFFVDEYGEEMFFFLGPNASDLVVMNLDFNDYVEEVKAAEIMYLPEELNNGLWVQVDFDDGFCSLMFANISTKKVDIIIQKDKPNNGEFFVVKQNEKGYYLEGVMRKYWLGSVEEDDTNERKLELVTNFDNDENYLIVKYLDEDSPRAYFYGIFDVKKRQLILDGALDIEDEYLCARIWYDNYQVLYNYKTQKFVTRPFRDGSSVPDSHHMLFQYTDIENTNHYYMYDTYNEMEHGPFDYIGTCVNDGNCVSVVPVNGSEDYRAFYDTDTQSFVNGVSYRGLRQINKGLVIYETPESRLFLFNTEKLTNVCELKPRSVFERFGYSETDYREMIYLFETPDGKRNLFSLKHGVFLPQGVDEFRKFTDRNHNVIQFKNNDRIYFLINGRNRIDILPSKQGIDSKHIGEVRARTLNDNSVYRLYIQVRLNDWSLYEVTYSPGSNEIYGITDLYAGKNVPVTDQDVIDKIQALFFPDKAQISEQFKNIINRMNDL